MIIENTKIIIPERKKIISFPNIIVPKREILTPENSLLRRHALLQQAPQEQYVDIPGPLGVSATTLTFAYNTVPVNGQLLYLVFCTQFGPVVSLSGSWTTLYDIGSPQSPLFSAWRIANNEPANYTITWTGVTTFTGVYLLALNGFSTVVNKGSSSSGGSLVGTRTIATQSISAGSKVVYCCTTNAVSAETVDNSFVQISGPASRMIFYSERNFASANGSIGASTWSTNPNGGRMRVGMDEIKV